MTRCTQKITDKTTHKQRRCKKNAIEGSKYCGAHTPKEFYRKPLRDPELTNILKRMIEIDDIESFKLFYKSYCHSQKTRKQCLKTLRFLFNNENDVLKTMIENSLNRRDLTFFLWLKHAYCNVNVNVANCNQILLEILLDKYDADRIASL